MRATMGMAVDGVTAAATSTIEYIARQIRQLAQLPQQGGCSMDSSLSRSCCTAADRRRITEGTHNLLCLFATCSHSSSALANAMHVSIWQEQIRLCACAAAPFLFMTSSVMTSRGAPEHSAASGAEVQHRCHGLRVMIPAPGRMHCRATATASSLEPLRRILGLLQLQPLVLSLHLLVRLLQRLEVDGTHPTATLATAGATAALRRVLGKVQPEEPELRYAREAVFERVVCGRLWQQHEHPPERLEQVGVRLRLEQLETDVREDGRLEELHELVDLHEERHRHLEPTELQDEFCRVFVCLQGGDCRQVGR